MPFNETALINLTLSAPNVISKVKTARKIVML